jgi:hypothetical protein
MIKENILIYQIVIIMKNNNNNNEMRSLLSYFLK